MHTTEETTWRQLASCTDDPDGVFFAADDNIGAIAKAKSICGSCPVSYECLVYAIDTNQPDGIWGGATLRERRRIKRRWVADEKQAS